MSYTLPNNTTVSAPPKLHYRFDNLTAPLYTPVDRVEDLSGNGFHLTPGPEHSSWFGAAGDTKRPYVWHNCNPSLLGNMTALNFSKAHSLPMIHTITDTTTGFDIEGRYRWVAVTDNLINWNDSTGAYGTTNAYGGIIGTIVAAGNYSNSISVYNSGNSVYGHDPRQNQTISLHNSLPWDPVPVVYQYVRSGTDVSMPLEDGHSRLVIGSEREVDWNRASFLDYGTNLAGYGSNAVKYENTGNVYNRGEYTYISLGQDSSSSSRRYYGRIYEVYCIDEYVWTQADLDKLQIYLRDKYYTQNQHIVPPGSTVLSLDGDQSISFEESDGLSLGLDRKTGENYPYENISTEIWFRIKGFLQNTTRHYIKPGYYFDQNSGNDVYNNPPASWIFHDSINGSTFSWASWTYQGLGMYYSPTNHYFYLGSSGKNWSGYLQPGKWYHIKRVAYDFNKEPYKSNNQAKTAVFINGQRISSTWDTATRRDGLSPLSYSIGQNIYSTHAWHYTDYPVKDIEQYYGQIDVAGFKRTCNDPLSTHRVVEYDYDAGHPGWATRHPMPDSPWEYDENGVAKPYPFIDNLPHSQTTAPKLETRDLGATIDMRIQMRGQGNPKIFGKFETSTPIWAGNYYFYGTAATTLDQLKVPKTAQTFKNTNLHLYSNRLNDITGLRDLYSIESGPSNDLPTSWYTLNLDSNRLEDFTDIEDSTFQKHGMWNTLYARYNYKLKSIKGLGMVRFKQLYASESYKTSETQEGLDVSDLHKRGGIKDAEKYANRAPGSKGTDPWCTYLNFNNTKIKTPVTTQWLSGFSYRASNDYPAGCGLYLDYCGVRDLTNFTNPASGIGHFTMLNQGFVRDYNNKPGDPKYTKFTGIYNLDKVDMPGLYQVLFGYNYFRGLPNDNTLPTVFGTRHRFLSVVDFYGTNISDFSCVAHMIPSESNVNATQQIKYNSYISHDKETTHQYSGRKLVDYAYFADLKFHPGSMSVEQWNMDDLPSEALQLYEKGRWWHQFDSAYQGGSNVISNTCNNNLVAHYNAGKRIIVHKDLRAYHIPMTDLRIFQDSFHGYSATVYRGHNSWHYVGLSNCKLQDTANSIGVMKNWLYVASLDIRHNNLTTFNNLFVNSGFVDPSWDRSTFKVNQTFDKAYLGNSRIKNLDFMLKTSFAGVRLCYLQYTEVDYNDLLAIESQLFALKDAGDIRLTDIYLQYSLMDRKFGYGNSSQWGVNMNYVYNWLSNYDGQDPMPGSDADTPIEGSPLSKWLKMNQVPEYSRCDGVFGMGDSPSPQQEMYIRWYNKGIKLHFNSYGSTYPHSVGDGQAPNKTYPNTYLDNVRVHFGTKDPLYAMQWSQSTNAIDTNNTLTVKFHMMPMNLEAGSKIVWSGFDTTNNPDQTLTLTGNAATIFGGTAEFAAGKVTCIVASGKTLLRDINYTLSFVLKNPTTIKKRSHPQISVITDHRGKNRRTNFTYYSEYASDATVINTSQYVLDTYQ